MADMWQRPLDSKYGCFPCFGVLLLLKSDKETHRPEGFARLDVMRTDQEQPAATLLGPGHSIWELGPTTELPVRTVLSVPPQTPTHPPKPCSNIPPWGQSSLTVCTDPFLGHQHLLPPLWVMFTVGWPVLSIEGPG